MIVISDKAPKLECRVKNVTSDGACLHVSATYGIPNRFDLIFGGKRQTCRVIWLDETSLGVMFV